MNRPYRSPLGPFDNSFLRDLPPDPHTDRAAQIRSRQVTGAAWSVVEPTPVAAPRLVTGSPDTAALLGIDPAALATSPLLDVLAGNALLPGMAPYATCYGGHQFGHWAGQLGDGRAISLGELLSPSGDRLELQLKGAGPTPYSRGADGRAVLRSSVREFLCSEAMHHLGVPTTRALSLVQTGDHVVRDMFYDGHPRPEPGAVVCRVAPSFIRFGHFEIHAARDDRATLSALCRHTLKRHFPHINPGPDGTPPSKDALLAMLGEVCQSTAALITHWLRVGFVHGVMNTDNLSILGLTIDYGPYGWLEPFDPQWTPNTTDAAGRRYRFGNQANAAHWNLSRLASALHPLIGEVAPLQEAIETFPRAFETAQSLMWAQKIGLDPTHNDNPALLDALFAVFDQTEVDMTLFFRGLSRVPVAPYTAARDRLAPIEAALYAPNLPAAAGTALLAWLDRWAARARLEARPGPDRAAAMDAQNPRYVLRNYLAQLAIDAAEAGDSSHILELLDVLRHPYTDQPGHDHLAARRPDWAKTRPGCAMLSCSS